MLHGDACTASLIRSWADHKGLSVSYASRLATGSGDTVDRIESGGMSLTVRRTARIYQYLSDHWPPHLEWPPDVPRPEPAREEEKEAA